jgi:hypothetical protein
MLSLAGCSSQIVSGAGGGTSGTTGAGGSPSTPAPKLPDSSFEDQPSQWQLGPTSAIDDTTATDGTHALRVTLDHGLGTQSVTRSAYLEDIELNRDYVFSFRYKYATCKKAIFVLAIGNYEKRLTLEGTNDAWTEGSLVVSLDHKPAWVDIYPLRLGAAVDYAGAEYDNNRLWLDDLRLVPK